LNGPRTAWSTPTVVWKGFGGTHPDVDFPTDDHLVGSPTVLKIGELYYLFIESYATWATRVARLYHYNRGDTWVTNGIADPVGRLHDWVEGYTDEQKDLGYAPAYRKKGTVPVYCGEVRYSANGKHNRFLSATAVADTKDIHGTWRPLNNGKPVFWVYETGLRNERKPLYTFWDGVHWNTYATNDPHGESIPGTIRLELLGYVAKSLNGKDLYG
jgi:hypothetical protein